MKKIKLKFIGAGINNFHQGNIRIYDINSNCIYSTKSYNGEIILLLKENSLYRIETDFDNLIRTVYINEEQNTYDFVLSNIVICNNRNNIITFLLTDQNYANLPIMNGEIILWQR